MGASMVIALLPRNQHSYSQARHSVPRSLPNSAFPPRAGFPSSITRMPRAYFLHASTQTWVVHPLHFSSSKMTLIVLSSNCIDLFLLDSSFATIFHDEGPQSLCEELSFVNLVSPIDLDPSRQPPGTLFEYL